MDIGFKIQKARLRAEMTQEQVAEALGISRQTLSNWENGKTYPDIVSVVKMSDLYGVSLDHLLKEEAPAKPYLSYLEDSTNTVKSNERKAIAVMSAVYLAVWAFVILLFWIFTHPGDALGYSVVSFVILLPTVTLTVSFWIGKTGSWGKRKWLFSIALGAMYMLADYSTFCVANMVSFQRLRLPRWEMLLTGTLLSLLGIAVGGAVSFLFSKRKRR